MEPSTDTVAPGPEARPPEFLRTGLDLLVVASGARIPLASADLYLGGRAEAGVQFVLEGLATPQLHFSVRGGRLRLANLDTSQALWKNGALVETAELAEGDQLQLGNHRLVVVKAGLLGSLECYGPPERGRLWSLGPQASAIGRAGKRPNQVEVNDPTLSRAHASVRLQGEGFVLLCETSSSPTMVNGQPLEPGQTRALVDQDLLRLGNVLFRFHLGASTLGDSKLRIFSIGAFEVFRGGERMSDTAWRQQSGRFLLACLAAEWPRPVALQHLRQLFWPDSERELARKNLNWALSTIKDSLGQEDVFVRTSQSVQLSGQVFGWHDLGELRAHLIEGQRQQAAGSLELAYGHFRQALELYRGPYLADCQLDWAVQKRRLLEAELVEQGVVLLRAATPEAVVELGRRLLQLDGCCQEAYLLTMRALRGLGRPQEAVRLFEACRRLLGQELKMEPSIELIREHELSQINL